MEIVRRKKRKPVAEINVVPYIDVMLVLLIVFMVTAPLLNQGIEVELPEVNNEPLNLDENLETIVISITANGDFYLSIGATSEDQAPVELAMVGEQISKIVEANPSIQVNVEGDTSAELGKMLLLLTTLQNAGVNNPNFITQPLSEL